MVGRNLAPNVFMNSCMQVLENNLLHQDCQNAAHGYIDNVHSIII